MSDKNGFDLDPRGSHGFDRYPARIDMGVSVRAINSGNPQLQILTVMLLEETSLGLHLQFVRLCLFFVNTAIQGLPNCLRAL